MANHEVQLVTSIAERIPQRVGGMVLPLTGGLTPELMSKWQSSGGKLECAFPDYRSLVEGHKTIRQLIEERRLAEAKSYVDEKTLPTYEELSPLEKWAYMTKQLPEDWGPYGPEDRVDMFDRLTSKARGFVLEAMCGFTTYIGDAPHIKHVVAMDWCKEGLERYSRPDRTRILFDLNTISSVGGMDFVRDAGFDSIVITFGVDYLNDPLAVFNEFHRILSDGGKILLIGGECQGYRDQKLRDFKPKNYVPSLKKAGFKTEVTKLPYRKTGELGDYYLIEGTK